MSLVNTNPKTGIAYGYVAASVLDSDIVDQLMFGLHTTDLSYRAAVCELAVEHGWEPADPDSPDFDAAEDFIDTYAEQDRSILTCVEGLEIEQPRVQGVYQQVSYESSWLGGALHFFIFDSPHKTDHASVASPCVPGAGILTELMDGSVTCYNVPPDWRAVPADTTLTVDGIVYQAQFQQDEVRVYQHSDLIRAKATRNSSTEVWHLSYYDEKGGEELEFSQASSDLYYNYCHAEIARYMIDVHPAHG